VKTLSAPLNAANTAQNPSAIQPAQTNWQYQGTHNTVNYTFPSNSVTTIVFRGDGKRR